MTTTHKLTRRFGASVGSKSSDYSVDMESSGASDQEPEYEITEEEAEVRTGGASGGDDDQSEGDDDEEDVLPKDVQYDIVRNERRRLVLKFLAEEKNPVSVGRLSEYVAGIENDKDPRMLDSQERKRAYVGLYQCHLPRMDDAGVIDYNKSRGVVALGPHAEEVVAHVEKEDDDEPTWAKLYLLSALLAIGGYAVAQLAIGTGWLAPAILVLGLAVVAGIAGYQLSLDDGDE
jgi:hypothetical protein